jgi:hypothetical protein
MDSTKKENRSMHPTEPLIGHTVAKRSAMPVAFATDIYLFHRLNEQYSTKLT